ncbi:RagB/SusD family nutrient uptake outer membrane protein [Chitinophaga sancti]|uniref:RagB/SusD family nutrient uptake outer membrane protein n=2 Tax=Chitinophaga sancti TaxID=1004 RepID=A0ABZ0XNJ8_9BACT|nr:RagB/SusD family nutrient uptake outer membrane protein [Chitinophaga sancti]WQD62175.1 RagB/SusD family nutrient uptake outer membrane protein [Chitinophaga sancti]WQG92256.1 RagB/SusD family nutrient uptake outer membrane protein [Chitinophaga sancti]
MNNKYLSMLLLGGLALASSCSKYTDIKTQGSLIPSDIDNYRYILNDTYSFESGGEMTDLAAADVSIVDAAQQSTIEGYNNYFFIRNIYLWKAPVIEVTTSHDPDWDTYYRRIYSCNVVINELPSSNGGTDSAKAELAAEALTHRADAYLNLVNEYAKPYNSATASSDLGVPLVLTQDLDQQLKRVSVAAIYNKVEEDLKTAVRSLPAASNYNTMPGKPAAYSLLARLYLLKGDYTNAGLYADSVLALKNTLNDLGTISSMPYRKSDPEIIFSKIAAQGFTYSPYVLRLSDDILNLLGTSDMRYQLFTKDAASYFGSTYTGRYFSREQINYENRNIGTSVPEMMLIKAEVLARAGSTGAAMDEVNLLRQKRFKAADYVALAATDKNDAVVKVIEERRREFMCRLLPWMDQRRLKDDPLFSKTYTRTWQGQTYTLEPSSNRYVFPIAAYVIGLNPEIEQNP